MIVGKIIPTITEPQQQTKRGGDHGEMGFVSKRGGRSGDRGFGSEREGGKIGESGEILTPRGFLFLFFGVDMKGSRGEWRGGETHPKLFL